MDSFFLKQQYSHNIWKILVHSSWLTVISMSIFLLAGEILEPESNLRRPNLSTQIVPLIIIGLVSAASLTVIIRYIRLVHSMRFLNLSNNSYKSMMCLIFVIYVFLLIGISMIFYKPSVDDGFTLLAIPFLLINGLWLLPIVGMLTKKI